MVGWIEATVEGIRPLHSIEFGPQGQPDWIISDSSSWTSSSLLLMALQSTSSWAIKSPLMILINVFALAVEFFIGLLTE